jgi:tetratricopeptide (TPR) repeat protein
MKMKKFIVTTISVAFVMFLMTNNVQAQKKFVTKAQIWAESGENLDTALKAIEFAETQEKTKEWGKTYYVKGIVYNAIATTENPEFQKICDYPLIKAFDNYKKAYDMNGSGPYQSAIDLKFISLANSFIEMAINTYNDKDYESSFMYFAKSLEVKGMSVFEGAVDTAILFNTAVAAQRVQKYDEAIEYYNKLIELEFGGGDTYSLMADCYKATGDTLKSLNQLKAGFEKYPENSDLIGGIINYYLSEADNSEGAFNYLKIAQEKNPENPQYILAEAQLLNKLGEFDKAKAKYMTAIEINPDLFEAQYNLGVLYFNEAIELRDKANEIVDNAKYEIAKEKADDKFREALPYIESAYNLSKEDVGIMTTLKNLYYLLKMTDKYEALSKEME